MLKCEQKLLILSFWEEIFLQGVLCIYLQIALWQKQKLTSRPLIGTVKFDITQIQSKCFYRTGTSVETPKRLPELKKIKHLNFAL